VRTLGGETVWLTLKRSLIVMYNDVYDEHLFVFAAGLSYYFVLSLFPLLVSMASLLGYVPIPHLFEGLLSLMARLVPGDGMNLVRSIVSDVASHKHAHFLTLGLVFSIWTVSSGFAAMMDGLDVVFRVRESRPVWKTRPIALALTLLAGSLLLVAVGLMVEGTSVGTWFTGRFDLNPALLTTWRYFRWGHCRDLWRAGSTASIPFRSGFQAAIPRQLDRRNHRSHDLGRFVVSAGGLLSTLRKS
jgi:membrane protein